MKGRPDTPSLYLSSDATNVDRFAAEEFQRCLTRTTGEPWRVCEGTHLPPHTVSTRDRVAIDKPWDGREHFRVRADQQGLTLCAGDDLSLVYAVYTFLEHLGCAWPRPGVDRIPDSCPDLASLNLKLDEKPALKWRGLCFDFTEVTVSMIDWMAKMRFNALHVCWSSYREPHWPGDVIFEEAKRRGLTCIMGGHALCDMLPLDQLYIEHPEYFCLLGGHRADPRSKGQKGWRLCHSNHELLDLVANAIVGLFERHPQLDGFSVWENDGYGNWCECDACRALDPAEQRFDPERGFPVRTERYLYFVQQIERRIRDRVGDKFLEFGAVYENALPPLRDDVLPSGRNVFFHDGYEFCGRHGYGEPCNHERMLRSVEGWTDRFGGNSRAFSYYNDAIGHGEIPLSLVTKIKNDAQTVLDCGLNGFHDLVTASRVDGLFDLWSVNLFAMSRLWWDPTPRVEEIIDQFLAWQYGEQGNNMRDYHTWVEAQTRLPGEGLYCASSEDWRHDPRIHTRAQLSHDFDLPIRAVERLDAVLASTMQTDAIEAIRALRDGWALTEQFFRGQQCATVEGRQQIAVDIWQRTNRTPGREDPRYYGYVTTQTRRWLDRLEQWDNNREPDQELDKVA